MVDIREYNYQIVNGKLLLGVEIETKGTNFYKDNKILVEFYKNNEVVKKDDNFIVPLILGNGILYVGNEYNIDIDFDDIKVSLILGKSEYEENNYSNITWSFDKIEDNKVVYKLISEVELSYAKLNLVFYNKGSLVCGTNIELNNLLSKRTYYFEYEIPKDIEYTEVYPFIILPNTGRLLFNSFFEKYKLFNKFIDENKSKIKPLNKTKESIEDQEIDKIDKEIKETEKDITRVSEKIVANFFDKIRFSVWNILKSIGVGLIAVIPLYIPVLIVFAIITYIVVGGNVDSISNAFMYSGTAIISFVIGFIFGLASFHPIVQYPMTYISKKDKETKLSLYNDRKEELLKKKEKLLREVEEANINIGNINQEIEEKNKDIINENQKYEFIVKDLESKREEFKDSYPNYGLINELSKDDYEIIEDAIELGMYDIDSVTNYYEDVKEKIRLMEEQRRKEELENKRIEAEIEFRKSIEAELSNLKSTFKAEMQRNNMETSMQMQNMMNEYAYISNSQSQRQLAALNNLTEKVKDQNINIKNLYNMERYGNPNDLYK